MSLPPVDPTDVEALLRRVLELSVPLHPAIEPFDELDADYRIAGAPGVALFLRDEGSVISHVSGSPSPALLEPLEHLQARHCELAGCLAGTSNSHLPALLLLCLYLADPASEERLGLAGLASRPASILPLDEEEGRHDPALEPLDGALRAWTPLDALHVPGAGVHDAILEMRFQRMRYERHVPWEGAAGETGQLHGGRHLQVDTSRLTDAQRS